MSRIVEHVNCYLPLEFNITVYYPDELPLHYYVYSHTLEQGIYVTEDIIYNSDIYFYARSFEDEETGEYHRCLYYDIQEYEDEGYTST